MKQLLSNHERLFVNRLAAKFGIIDVDALHDSLTREQMIEHQAMAVIDGWYHGRANLAHILSAIQNGINRLVLMQCSDPEKAHRKMQWTSPAEILDSFTAFEDPKSDTRIELQDMATELQRRFG